MSSGVTLGRWPTDNEFVTDSVGSYNLQLRFYNLINLGLMKINGCDSEHVPMKQGVVSFKFPK